MKKKERWVFVVGDRRFIQLSSQGKLRKLHKSMYQFGIHVYQQQKFSEVEFDYKVRKIEQSVVKIPTARMQFWNEGPQNYSIAVLMFRCFYGVVNLHSNEIIHLDGNELNNEFDNLFLAKADIKLQYMRLVLSDETFKENIEVRNNLLVRKISKYDFDGRLQQVYPNLKKAIEDEGVLKSEMLRALQYGRFKPINNHIFLPGVGPELIHFVMEPSCLNTYTDSRSTLLYQYSESGELIKVYVSVEQAVIESEISKQNIIKSIKLRKIVENYLWVLF
jgi:hypothetical protein